VGHHGEHAHAYLQPVRQGHRLAGIVMALPCRDACDLQGLEAWDPPVSVSFDG